MTKFKILSWVLKILIALHIAGCIAAVYTLYLISDHNLSLPNVSDIITHTSISIPIQLMFAAGLYFVHQSCIMFIKRSHFNSKSALYLIRGGYILAITALLGIAIRIITSDIPTDRKKLIPFIETISNYLLWFIIGFALIAVADIIKKGSRIKQENDLTI